MSRPWMKFYPSDWRADPALRMCSMGARGLWMEMLCVMHEASPRGSLLVNSKQVDPKQLAALAGIPVRQAAALLAELESAGVFSRESDGTIFSRRIRRDEEKAELDKANGSAGGNPKLTEDKRGVNPPHNGDVKAHMLEARNKSSEAKASGATAPADDPKVAYFRRAREVLGKGSGSLIAKLLRSQGAEDDPRTIAKARAHIETASTKADPSEWLGRVLRPRNGSAPLTDAGNLWPEGIV